MGLETPPSTPLPSTPYPTLPFPTLSSSSTLSSGQPPRPLTQPCPPISLFHNLRTSLPSPLFPSLLPSFLPSFLSSFPPFSLPPPLLAASPRSVIYINNNDMKINGIQLAALSHCVLGSSYHRAVLNPHVPHAPRAYRPCRRPAPT